MPFTKGQSGNPAGRPAKERTLTEALRAKLDPERFTASLLDMAYAGDMKAARLVLLYVDGPPEGTSEDENNSAKALAEFTASVEAAILRIYGTPKTVQIIDVTGEATGEDGL